MSRRQGSGTIVTRKPVDDNFKLTAGYSEIARRAGRRPESRVLKVRRLDATESLLSTFQLPPAANVGFMSFQRLMTSDGRPNAVITAYVLEDLGQQLLKYKLDNTSFYRLYEEILGRKVTRNENILSPINVSPEAARLLAVDPGSAHMHIRGVSYIEGGLAVEMSVGIFSGDFFEWKADTYEVRDAEHSVLPEQVYGDI